MSIYSGMYQHRNGNLKALICAPPALQRPEMMMCPRSLDQRVSSATSDVVKGHKLVPY